MTIVMVLHDINQAIYYSDAVIGLCDGKAQISGDPEEVVTRESIWQLFQVDLQVSRIDGKTFVLPVAENGRGERDEAQ